MAVRSISLLLLPLCLQSASALDWSQSQAFQHFYNLRYDQAVSVIEKEVAKTPDDPNGLNHLAYALLYRALFRGGALDNNIALSPMSFLRQPKIVIDPAEEKRFLDTVRRSMELSEQRIARNPKDAEALYALGVAHVHRANFQFLIHKSWRDALSDGTKGRKLHQQLAELDRSFVDARLVPAVHDYVVGSLPWMVRMLGFLAGFRGDKANGLKGMEEVARNGRRTQVEAQVLLALSLRREQKPDQAARWLEALARRFESNHLYRMEWINSLLAAGNREQARREVQLLSDRARYPALKPEQLKAIQNRVAEPAR